MSVATFALYGAGSRLKTQTSGNGMVGTWGYDGFRRPTDIAHKTSGSTERAGYEYVWDKNNNPLSEAHRHDSGKGFVYSYDKANRLTRTLVDVDDPAAEVATPNSEAYVTKHDYNMDDLANFTSCAVTPYGGSPTTTSYSTNSMNEYTAVGGVSHTYTDNGALEDDGTNFYVYDAHDRLIEVDESANHSNVVAMYAYDALGLGRRTSKTVGSDVTRYVYAGLQSVEELDGSDDLLRLYVFGDRIDQVVMMEAPDQADVDNDSNTSELQRFFFHTQLIGSVTHVTSAAETVVERYAYDPYGKITIKDKAGSVVSGSPIGNAYTYTARQLDEETGLYYYRARQYSPVLRRFVQRDPFEYVSGPNATMYAGDSVTSRTDPLGLDDSSPIAPPGPGAPLPPPVPATPAPPTGPGVIDILLGITWEAPQTLVGGLWWFLGKAAGVVGIGGGPPTGGGGGGGGPGTPGGSGPGSKPSGPGSGKQQGGQAPVGGEEGGGGSGSGGGSSSAGGGNSGGGSGAGSGSGSSSSGGGSSGGSGDASAGSGASGAAGNSGSGGAGSGQVDGHVSGYNPLNEQGQSDFSGGLFISYGTGRPDSLTHGHAEFHSHWSRILGPLFGPWWVLDRVLGPGGSGPLGAEPSDKTAKEYSKSAGGP